MCVLASWPALPCLADSCACQGGRAARLLTPKRLLAFHHLLPADITQPARTALAAGCEGVSAINTITSVMGINLDTLRPEPTGAHTCLAACLPACHTCS
jgi:hypothetical protein